MEDQNIETQDLKEHAEEDEFGISDKFIAVFTEPKKLFTDLSTQKPKTSDWLVPLSFIITVVLLMQLVIFVKPSLKDQAVLKQMAAVEVQLDAAVADGRISQAVADAQYEQTYDALNNQLGRIMIFNGAITVVFFLIFFFIASGFFVGITKFGLNGQGTYKQGLSAYGLPMYISILQLIINILLIVITDSIDTGTNLAKITGMEVKEFSGYMASFVDPFSIWFYSILGVSFARMFKSESTGKYVVTFIASWLTVGVIFYFVAQQVPILQNLIQ
jgi:hypothetical protein